MQGRGTTHRGNRFLRATAWLQHPSRPAIRQEAGRSSQAVHPFRETSLCGNACCRFALCRGTAPPCPRQLAGYANSTHRFTFHHGVNQGFWHHPKQSAPVDDIAPRTPTCLKTISAPRLPHLSPPGQPSLATNVPRLVDDGAVNGLLATAALLHRPSP